MCKQMILSAMNELIGAQSSLHMYPDPIPKNEISDDARGFLSEIDVWCKHSIEHSKETFKKLKEIEEMVERIKYELFKLVRDNKINESDYEKIYKIIRDL